MPVDKIFDGDLDSGLKHGGSSSWSDPISEYEGTQWSLLPNDELTPSHFDNITPSTPSLNGGGSGFVIKPTGNGNVVTRASETDSSENPTGQKIEGGVGPATPSDNSSDDKEASTPTDDVAPVDWTPDGSFLSWLGFLQLMWQGLRDRTLAMSGIDGTGSHTFHTKHEVYNNDPAAWSAFENWIIEYTNDINNASGMTLSWTSMDYLNNENLSTFRDDMLTWWYNNVWEVGQQATDDAIHTGGGGIIIPEQADLSGGGISADSSIGKQQGDSPVDGDKSASTSGVTMSFKDMEDQITNLLSLLYGNNLTQFSSGLIGFFRSLNDYVGTLGLKDASAKVNFIQNIYNALASNIGTQLSALYERENWLFQTDYNSPVNSMARLMEAGINPAFYYSGLEKSNAGSVGSTQVQSPSSNAIQDTTASPAQRLAAVAGAAGQIGGIFNSGIGAAGSLVQNVASAKFSDENRIDLVETRPSRISEMYGSAAASQANAGYVSAQTPAAADVQQSTIEANMATAYFNRTNARALWKQLDLKSKEIDNALTIARLTNDTSRYVSDVSAAATRYASFMGYKSTLANVQGSSLVNILQNMYDVIDETVYEDSTTGQVYNTEQLRQQAIESGVELGTDVDFGVLPITANGKVSAKSSSLSSLKSGQSFSFGNKRYTVKTRSAKEFNPIRYKAALQLYTPLWEGLKNGTVNNAQFNAGISEIFGIVDDEQNKLLPYLSGRMADYHLQYVDGLTGSSFTNRVK